MKRWFDRSFPPGHDAAEAPELLRRLSAAPDRLEAAVSALPDRVRLYRPGGRWSVQEQAGHLGDLEELWLARLDDFEAGAPVLRPADLQNRRTHDARHNTRPAAEVLARFRTARASLLSRLHRWGPSEWRRESRHPRLGVPMSVTDFCFFAAEHDDHHLASIAELATRAADLPPCALDLSNTVDRLEPWLAALDADTASRLPAAGGWSPAEVLGHLVDSAANNHQRFVLGAGGSSLVFPGYEQDRWVAIQEYRNAPWRDLVTLWAAYNRHLARVMAAVPEPVRRRQTTEHTLDRIASRPVPAGSPATLEYLMEDYVRHLEHHLDQIARLTGAATPA